METFVKQSGKLVVKEKQASLLSLTRFEKLTIVIVTMMVTALMVAAIYTRSSVSQVNATIELVKLDTEKINVENQLLQQKIDDLLTHDRIVQLAKAYGFNRNDNVKAVNK